MGIGNRTLPALQPATPARTAVRRPGEDEPVMPVVDLGARVAAARQAADLVRRRAAGGNAPARPRRTTPAPGVLNLNPSPGSWRLY